MFEKKKKEVTEQVVDKSIDNLVTRTKKWVNQHPWVYVLAGIALGKIFSKPQTTVVIVNQTPRIIGGERNVG